MTLQSMRREMLAPDLELRIHEFLKKLWNDKDVMFRHDFRMLFYGVKPSKTDFLINTAIALYAVYNEKSRRHKPPVFYNTR